MIKVKEHCGVFASMGEGSVHIVYEGLKLLQHRGEESAGISFLNGENLATIKGLGLVDEAIGDKIGNVFSNVSIGHVRYSTTGKTTIDEAQPLSNDKISIAFNGTITNYFQFGNFSTDTEFILNFMAKYSDPLEGLSNFMASADGAYSMVIMWKDGRIFAVRDPHGFRPLVLGRINNNLVISSEDSAIIQMGGKVIRDVKPGEVVVFENDSFLSYQLQRQDIAVCSFEYIYFSRSDTSIDGYPVYDARIRLGEVLAEKHPANAQIVVPVPDSARPIALGFSRKTGIPIEEGLVRTLNSKRSFILPSDRSRVLTLEEKFGVVSSAIKGKDIALIDDSIVRGNTMRRIIQLLRRAGAEKIHVRIGSPMIRYPCYMGIDFPRRDQLIAFEKDESKIAKSIGADSVKYLTKDEMVEAIGRKDLCVACFTGKYPLKGNYNLGKLEVTFRR
ncbi:amidophosphoribosyltransferase [Candidatus Acidianus copahuensis]|uniref:Amidophosphoribosyltransferase n=1 Tax=Candidatus Acidianus copahuensis TaxID=1160895 RepID=A0A031LN65_9CREN|nr:amidophosphoribosyltransferase [Candidatus Acidianus copahuensis]EZQ04845.1 amidophosphoribosyltransferase [Candidatus Acidianus copahuensis]